MSDPARQFTEIVRRSTDPVQIDYETIRPIMLDDQTVTERSQTLGMDRTTVGDKARRFVENGMLGLVDQRTTQAGRRSHAFPDPVARHILFLKHYYPPIHYREIVRIVEHKFGYRTSHHTVKRFLDRHDILIQLELKLPPTFHEFTQAYQARWTVIRMFYEGWNEASIAGCLKLSRVHVDRLIATFHLKGFAGLEDHRFRPTDHPSNQLSLPFLEEVLQEQQKHPHTGRYRLQGLLEADRTARNDPTPVPSEATVGRAMAINRQEHDAPGPWPPPEPTRERNPDGTIRYVPLYRHHYWFIDIRYLIQIGGKWCYSICILEGYSRKLIAGMASEYQDEIAVLQLLHAALSAYGAPEGLVSDNGAVFCAHVYVELLNALDIRYCLIEKGEPWNNLIEAQFKIQSRLGDPHFEKAKNFEELQQEHAIFIETFNTTSHYAHKLREDKLHTPEKVLGEAQGRHIDPTLLQRLVRSVHVERTVNAAGFVSIQRFCLYAERGLAHQRVSVWIYDGRVDIEHEEWLLAHYKGHYDRRKKRLVRVEAPMLYQTPFVSPQLELLELDDDQWQKVWQRQLALPRRRQHAEVTQLPLLVVEGLAVVLLYILLKDMGGNFFPISIQV